MKWNGLYEVFWGSWELLRISIRFWKPFRLLRAQKVRYSHCIAYKYDKKFSQTIFKLIDTRLDYYNLLEISYLESTLLTYGALSTSIYVHVGCGRMTSYRDAGGCDQMITRRGMMVEKNKCRMREMTKNACGVSEYLPTRM